METPTRLRPLRLLTNHNPEASVKNPRSFHVYEVKEHEPLKSSDWYELTGKESVFQTCQELVPLLTPAAATTNTFDFPVDINDMEDYSSSYALTSGSKPGKLYRRTTSSTTSHTSPLIFDVVMDYEEGTATLIPLTSTKTGRPRVSSMASRCLNCDQVSEAIRVADWQHIPLSAGPYEHSFEDHIPSVPVPNTAPVEPEVVTTQFRELVDTVAPKLDGKRSKRFPKFDRSVLFRRPSAKIKESAKQL